MIHNRRYRLPTIDYIEFLEPTHITFHHSFPAARHEACWRSFGPKCLASRQGCQRFTPPKWMVFFVENPS